MGWLTVRVRRRFQGMLLRCQPHRRRVPLAQQLRRGARPGLRLGGFVPAEYPVLPARGVRRAVPWRAAMSRGRRAGSVRAAAKRYYAETDADAYAGAVPALDVLPLWP